VGIRAQTRVPGQSVSQYLHTSIVDPDAYIVDGYPDLMPKNWGKVFTEAQVNDLVAYLISLSN
jgi:cytochrome c